MESVRDTPVKRRKTETGHVSLSQAYNSQDDSGDDLFAEYETVATVPVAKMTTTQGYVDVLSSPAPGHITQPTQIIDRNIQTSGMPGRKPSLVQVAASSPLKSPLSSAPTKRGGILANSMAPPGTAFRLPLGVTKRPPVIDLSDDERAIQYLGGSSDEESQSRLGASIKPSTFIARAQQISQSRNANPGRQDPPNNALNKFNEITSRSFYKPLESNNAKRPISTLSGSVFDSRNRDESNTTSRIPAPKRSADVMANAYGSSCRPAKQLRQTAPAKASPVVVMSLDEAEDYGFREKIKRIQFILPNCTVDMCLEALVKRKGNIDDALDYIAEKEDTPAEIDLTISDNELNASRAPIAPKISAKQQLKAPNRTIQEKYTSTQIASRNTQNPGSSLAAPLPRQRRRLVQGRKNRSSPVLSSPVVTPIQRHVTPESLDSDSGVGFESEEDPELEENLLNFFNTCSVEDLADIAAITEKVAALIIAKRPFRGLDAVRQVSEHAPQSNAAKKKSTKRPVGEKIVATCERVWTGYEAVDELVRRCEALGKPIAEEMRKWGVNVFGASKDGELELVSFDNIKTEEKSEKSSLRDSGIGTPTSGPVSADEGDGDVKNRLTPQSRLKTTFFPQPSVMAPKVILKDYQVVGINWLSLLFDKKLSCILADDMGLGKTCQVIAFLASLLERGIKGPHLIIVPGSTLENWLREFQMFCPTLHVMPYYAGQKERPGIRDDILESRERPNVIVTTYGIAKIPDDTRFLRRLKPKVCVFDEGHYLKSAKSAVYEQLMKITADFRLLLTGTPLQNNLEELASLLGFILPTVFDEHKDALSSIFNQKATTKDESHSALLSAQRIARARSMMTPFILRRKKHQVLKYLPSKTRRVEYCELTPSQHEIYTEEQDRVRKINEERATGVKGLGKETTNIMMNLRKASIHPLLFRRIYDNKTLSKMARDILKEEEYQDRNLDLVYEDMTVMTDFELHGLCSKNPDHMSRHVLEDDLWMDSGKVMKLCQLLLDFKANGDRVLVFSQFTMVMDILEAVMESLDMQYFRLDGSTDINDRQAMIDEFYTREEITVFLLSTKAGGAGINLACANKVIIFDSSFNPQDDIQAENRAHRVGQTREVEVIRLISRGTIEEHIYRLGEAKLVLDDRVAGGVADEDSKKVEKAGEKQVQEMLLKEINGETTNVVERSKVA